MKKDIRQAWAMIREELCRPRGDSDNPAVEQELSVSCDIVGAALRGARGPQLKDEPELDTLRTIPTSVMVGINDVATSRDGKPLKIAYGNDVRLLLSMTHAIGDMVYIPVEQATSYPVNGCNYIAQDVMASGIAIRIDVEGPGNGTVQEMVGVFLHAQASLARFALRQQAYVDQMASMKARAARGERAQ